MIINPSTGRCIKMDGPIGKKLLSQPNMPLAPIKPNKQPLLSLDTNSDNYISIKEYLSTVESRGPNEKPGGTSFSYYNQRDLGITFLLILIEKQKGPIHEIACIPPFSQCIYKKPNGEYYSELSEEIGCKLPKNINNKYIGGGKTNHYASIIILNAPLHYQNNNMNIFIPSNFKNIINKCKNDNKNMVICDLSLLSSDDMMSASHANVLTFDLQRRIIERFDPHGNNIYETINKNEEIIGRKDFKFGEQKKSSALFNQDLIDLELRNIFNKIIPEFKYSGTYETCPYLGPQIKTDAYDGLCVTWSAMYMLLRLLNTQLNPVEITKKMIEGTNQQLLSKILRFQKYVIDTIRDYKKKIK